jgi:hypothetical protein
MRGGSCGQSDLPNGRISARLTTLKPALGHMFGEIPPEHRHVFQVRRVLVEQALHERAALRPTFSAAQLDFCGVQQQPAGRCRRSRR